MWLNMIALINISVSKSKFFLFPDVEKGGNKNDLWKNCGITEVILEWSDCNGRKHHWPTFF